MKAINGVSCIFNSNLIFSGAYLRSHSASHLPSLRAVLPLCVSMCDHKPSPMKQNQSLLKELGIKPVVNAAGTVTVLGGCLVHDEVFVDMNALHEKIGAFVAELVGSEAAYVTSGAAAGLVLSVGACMTNGDADLMHKLPCGAGIVKNEVIVQKLHRNMYDHNLEVGGASIREIGSEEKTSADDLRKAISQRTAAVVYFAYDPQNGVLPLSEVIALSHERGIPVIVDAAAELPPVENLTKYLKMGADIV